MGASAVWVVKTFAEHCLHFVLLSIKYPKGLTHIAYLDPNLCSTAFAVPHNKQTPMKIKRKKNASLENEKFSSPSSLSAQT